MKLFRTIRLDPSDTFVYERAAAAGEWAVPGTFEFWGAEPGALAGRARQAFRAGFLGLGSFGWSTLVVAQPVTPLERAEAVESLAGHLLRAHGAPSLEAARAAAEEEIAGAIALAEHPEGTLIALHRTLDRSGDIREQFRTLRPSDALEAAQMPCSAGAFAIIEESGAGLSDAPGASEAVEEVSLVGLAQSQRTKTP